jgi:hypothetical protein
MRPLFAALALAALPVAAAAAPPGAEACEGAYGTETAYRGCVAAVLGPCEDRRAEEGDPAWAACLSDRAEAWETELAARANRLRAMGHEAGGPGALEAFLSERSDTCRNPERIAELKAEHEQAAVDGAILRCELVNSLHRALLLDKIAREARAEAQ